MQAYQAGKPLHFDGLNTVLFSSNIELIFRCEGRLTSEQSVVVIFGQDALDVRGESDLSVQSEPQVFHVFRPWNLAPPNGDLVQRKFVRTLFSGEEDGFSGIGPDRQFSLKAFNGFLSRLHFGYNY